MAHLTRPSSATAPKGYLKPGHSRTVRDLRCTVDMERKATSLVGAGGVHSGPGSALRKAVLCVIGLSGCGGISDRADAIGGSGGLTGNQSLAVGGGTSHTSYPDGGTPSAGGADRGSGGNQGVGGSTCVCMGSAVSCDSVFATTGDCPSDCTVTGTPSCKGPTLGCSAIPFPLDCAKAEGCAWDIATDACSGSKTACSLHGAPEECALDGTCSWIGSCTGITGGTCRCSW